MEQEVTAHEDASTWKGRAARLLLGESGTQSALRVRDSIRHNAARRLTRAGRANDAYIRSFADIHHGQRCVIIGNGPSLRETDMSLLKGEITFGLNRLYLMFDDLGFASTYHVVVNRLVVEQCAQDFRALSMPLFSTTPNRGHLRGSTQASFLRSLHGLGFSTDPTRGVWEGATVTYVAMQLAFFMGFTQVILVGVDHKFAVTGRAHQVVESAGDDASHFDPRYFGKGFRWQLPDLETSEHAYALARRSYEEAGRQIVDATVGGNLRIFPREDLASVLGAPRPTDPNRTDL